MQARVDEGWPARWRDTLRAVRVVPDDAGQALLLEQLARPVQPTVLAFVNAHAMNSMVGSPAFFRALAGADLLLRDGSGMALLMRLLGQPPGLNLNGTDLIPRIVERYAGRRIAFYGTAEPYLSAARGHAAEQLAPGSHWDVAHGFLPTAAYLERARAQQPDLVVLGMGMPRQEEVARELRTALAHPCLIVCGGAIIDFMGGKTPRAPRWMRAAGIEWAWRLGLEPRRLFRRYVVGNPLFILRALRLAPLAARKADREVPR